jgi:2-polyprenyl-3-methyl-5-hydroxy-6-metoxy-1,4-benzoquinol methylase
MTVTRDCAAPASRASSICAAPDLIASPPVTCDRSASELRPCPACGEPHSQWAFVSHGFPLVRCSACETLFVAPLPSASVVQATYLEPDYHETAVGAAARMRAEAQARAQVLAELGATRVIEVGCGPGHFLDAVRELGLHVEGVDPARTAVAAAARGHVVHPIFLEQLDPSRPFDALALWEVIEHLPDPHDALRRMRAWLVPGAVLALSTPSMSGLPARLLGRNYPMITPPDHLALFTRRGLAQLLDRTGFEPVRWTSFSNLDAATLARAVERRVLRGRARPLAAALGWLGRAPAAWIDRAGLGTSFEVYARAR